MRSPLRLLVGATTIVLVATACSPVSTDKTVTTSSSPPTTVAQTTSSVPPETSTTAETTTTTPLPLASVRVDGELPEDLSTTVDSFLSVVQDPRNDSSNIDADLVAHHLAGAGALDDRYDGAATIQELETGGAVGVVTLDNGDLLLLADEGSGWTVVGAHLASVGIDPWFGQSPRRVLVLGSDARPGSKASVFRMDSIHVLTAVPALGTGTILGWPRDTWVDTPYGEMRINALTSSRRGPDALFTHFTETWEIPLDGYILTAFSGFEKLVAAAVGRLMITLPGAVPVQDWWPGFSVGEQRLTPERTLDLARTRKRLSGGDFKRSWHQGLIMLATLTMLQQGSVEDVPVLVGALVKYTDTNLTPTDLVQLGAAAFYMDVGEVVNEVLPGQLGRAGNGASVVFLDPEADAIIQDVIEDGIRNNG